MSLMPKQEYSLMAAAEKEHWWYKSLRRTLLTALQTFSLGKEVLDAGCGTGENSLFLLQNGYTVNSLDLSAVAIKLARQKGLQKITRGSVTKLPYPASKFSVVISIDVLGALPFESDIQRAVQESWRVLKPEGVLVLQVAALPWLLSTHDSCVGNKKRFTKSELRRVLPRTEWKVERCEYRYFFLFPLIVMVKLFEKFFPAKSLHSDVNMSNKIINSFLDGVMKCEEWWAKRTSFPIGSSLFVVARKV